MNVIKCENYFCIYQDKGVCKNENEPDIDWRGFCKNMVPVRVTRRTLDTEKMLTRFKMKDGNHCFNRDIGMVTMTDEAFEFYNTDLNLD
ncbi:MAG: hypothetical protein IKB36_03065 [Clostridia bacterium]|nr:hypothetical protein [Clostridia bacterium]